MTFDPRTCPIKQISTSAQWRDRYGLPIKVFARLRRHYISKGLKRQVHAVSLDQRTATLSCQHTLEVTPGTRAAHACWLYCLTMVARVTVS